MSAPRWETCPHCQEMHDTSGRYTSPENRKKDAEWWAAHLRGECPSLLPRGPVV